MIKLNTDEARIRWIHDATAYELLYTLRMQEPDGPMLSGKVGKVYREELKKKREMIGEEAWAALVRCSGV